MRAGQQSSFPLTFPADYPASKVAGRAAQFSVTLKRVEQVELPEVNADFARALGIPDGDLTKMRADLRVNLEREVASRLRSRTREDVLGSLLRAMNFEVPQSLLDQELQSLGRLTATGEPGGAERTAPAAAELQEAARRRVRLGLLIGELMMRHGLQPRQDQVRKAVEAVAQSYENPAEVIQWYLGSRERLAQIEAGLTEDNVVAWALQHARVSEVALPFDELMGGRN
jgi:trigger factor